MKHLDRESIVEIRNTADFLAALDATIAEVDALVASEPNYGVWGMLQQQLHAMKAWSTSTKVSDADRLNSITIGRIAARELEPTDQAWMQDLIDRLHLLNHHWRHWPNGEAPIPTQPQKWLGKFAITLIVVAVVVVGALFALRSIALLPAGPATPIGQPMPIPGATATLTSSLEPQMVSLHPNPESERQFVQLKLTDPAHKRPDRLIPIARHMQRNELLFGAKLLGDDGHRLWFYVGSIGAWDYREDTLVDAENLRRANPGLGLFAPKDNRGDPLISPAVRSIKQPSRDLWSGEPRLYGFNGRLQVTTPDFKGVYEIDPETLHATVK